MPGVLIHRIIAQRLLPELMRREPLLREEAGQNLFFAGAWGPDIGAFPGADPFVCDLAHYVNTAGLGRAFFNTEAPVGAREFGLGWISHLVADAAIHPLINAAAGERVRGSRDMPLTWADDPSWHQRVEIGLDGVLWAQQPTAAGAIVPSWPDLPILATTIGVLQYAYTHTYGAGIVPEAAIQRSVLSGYGGMKRLGEFAILDGRRFLSLGIPRALRYAFVTTYLPLRILTKALGTRFVHHGIGSTVFPQDWLIAETQATIEKVIETYLHLYTLEFKPLRSLNLDTGEESPDYPLQHRALAELNRRSTLLS